MLDSCNIYDNFERSFFSVFSILISSLGQSFAYIVGQQVVTFVQMFTIYTHF